MKPKRFRCKNCANEYYTDAPACPGCDSVDSILPIPIKYYRCYLNGELYAVGSMEVILNELQLYFEQNKMYGKTKAKVVIEEAE